MRRPPFLKTLAGSVENFYRDECFDRAVVFSYFALLSFLPLAVVMVAFGTRALGSLDAAERGTEVLLRNVLYRLPPQVMTQVRSLQEGIWSGLSYLLIALWSASHVFNKVEASLDFVFRVERRRHWALRKLLAVGVVGLFSLLLVVTVVVGSLLGAVERFIDTSALAPLRSSELYRTLNGFTTRYLVPWVLAMGAFFTVYWIVPARRVPVRAALAAALVAGTLWEALKLGFTYYVSNLASYDRTYGALATVVVLLAWVNLSAVLLLWGGELAAVAAGARAAPGPDQRAPD